MRNLKKFLALVLAMMMVFSLMATVSATSFPDDGNISDDYRQAVEVLSAIKVFKGDDDGKLNPKDPIKRAEFATVLYRVATGDVDGKSALLNTMADYDQFSDVNANSYPWAAKYINYAAQAGWLKGDEGIGGTYRPEDNVTVYQVLVALLRVLELGDGITSDNWVFETAMKAGNIGLHAGLEDGDMGGTATREMIAQLALNAMTYVPGENGKAGQPVVKWALEGVTEHFNTTTEAESYATQNGMGKAGEEGGPAIEKHTVYPDSLAFNNFDHLHKVEGGYDDFERPTVSWNTEKEAAVVENYLEPDFPVYYGTFTGKDAKALLKAVKNDEEKISVYYNGGIKNDTGNPTFQEDKTAPDGESGLWWDDTTGINGYETWVYREGNGYRIVVREAYVAQVTAATRAGNNIYLDVYEMGMTDPSAGGNWLLDPSSVTTPQFTVTTADEDLYNTLAKYENEAYVAVYMNPNWNEAESTDTTKILEVASLKEEKVCITWIEDNVKKTLSTIIVNDGAAEYKVNNEAMVTDKDGNWYGNVVNGTNDNSRATALGDATLYLLNGNILLIKQEEVAADTGLTFAYLIDYRAVSGFSAGDNWTPDWEQSFGYRLDLKLRLPNGKDEIITWMIPNEDYVSAVATPNEDPYIVQYFEYKEDAEALGEGLLNLLYEYDPATGLITLVAGNEYSLSVGDMIADEYLDDNDSNMKETGLKDKLDALDWDALGYPAYSGNANIEGEALAADAEKTANKVDIKYNRAAGTLGTEDQVIFDSKTVIFVANTLSAKNKKNADLDIYNGIMDPELAKRQDGAASSKGKIVNGSETYVQYVWDNGVDNEGGSNRIIAVLIALPGPDKEEDPGEDENVYFVMINETATLNWKYTDKTHTDKIEYYSPAATVNHVLQGKNVFEGSKDMVKPGIYFGKGSELDDNDMFLDVETDWASDEEHQITKIEWSTLNKAFNITDGNDKVTGCLVTADLKIFYFDTEKGTVEEMSVNQVASKMGENMVGFMDIKDREVKALYLTILPDTFEDYDAFIAAYVTRE